MPITKSDIVKGLSRKRKKESLESLEDRLWKRITKRGKHQCWLWNGCRLVQDGVGSYGRIGVNGRLWLVHRLIYTLKIGTIPDGMDVLHRCDNPPCCNPAHYFLGTQKDNNHDAIKKGRGYNNGKLTEKQASEIRRSKAKISKLADEYGVSASMIEKIRYGVVWRHTT